MKSFAEWNSGKICVINRGVPGSGKSFTARQVLEKHGGGEPKDHIFSTDDYFGSGEEYRKNWAPDKLGKAHDWNFERFKDAVNKGVTPVIVDNTNVKRRDFMNYAHYARNAGYKVVVQEPSSPWWGDHAHMLNDKQKHGTELEDFARFLAGHHQGMEAKYGVTGNTHGVPLETIRNMLRKWQPNINSDNLFDDEFHSRNS
jgi:NEDD4-binding protein 2